MLSPTTAAAINWIKPAPNVYFQANYNGGASANVSTYQTLDFRISRRHDDANRLEINPLNNLDAFSNISLQLVMADGKTSVPVELAKYIVLQGPVGTLPKTNGRSPNGTLHPILRGVRIPVTDFTGVDLTQIKAVRFSFNDTKQGTTFLANVRFSK